MPTIPQRIASAFAVLCGRYGDVTRLARDREQSRQSLYREAERVADAVDGNASRAQIDELQRRLAEQRATVQALEERLRHAVSVAWEAQEYARTLAERRAQEDLWADLREQAPLPYAPASPLYRPHSSHRGSPW